MRRVGCMKETGGEKIMNVAKAASEKVPSTGANLEYKIKLSLGFSAISLFYFFY